MKITRILIAISIGMAVLAIGSLNHKLMRAAYQSRYAELKRTGLFDQRGSGIALLEAETALLALEWPKLGQDARNARLDNLEALVRLSR